jgi:hypothetical protein
MAYNFVAKERTRTAITSGTPISERLSGFQGLKLNLCSHKFKDDRKAETVADTMADNTAHWLL